jgi:tetratricopeptide (TPR) repeat protein
MWARLAISISLGLVVALTAHAAPAKDRAAKAAEQKAKKHFEDAEAHYKVRDYEEALAGYREAYLLSKQPVLLFNIAQCYRLLGRYEEARSSYRTFLREAPDHPVRPEVERLIAEVEARLAKAEGAAATNPAENPTGTPASQGAAATPQPKGQTTLIPPGYTPAGPARLFYGAAVAAGVLGLASGGLALEGALESRRLDRGEDRDVRRIQAAFERGRTFGLLADALVGVAVVSGGVGYALSRREHRVKPTLMLTPGGVALTVGIGQ